MGKIKIGKNIIETLTQGMYEDARFVFREYIQNSADQIDKAVSTGVLDTRNNGFINVLIDTDYKTIQVEDNATGIKSKNILESLGNIALSEKDRKKDKGFRGIGRLGGLAYCKKLIFETSFKGENVKSVMTWDAEKLNNIINDPTENIAAENLIELIINLEYISEDEDKHYFKVKLEEVNNKKLLDTKNIIEYLSMIAPVSFPNHFIFSNKIKSLLADNNLEIDEYKIFVNTDLLEKSYTSSIYEKSGNLKRKIDEVFDIEPIKINNDGDLLAWGWYGLTNFEKQISNINIARGIRLRKGNIQIGSENTLIKLHKEQRSNFYFIGEIHAFHPELIPNSRRDYFNENDVLKEFEKQVKKLFYDKLYRQYYHANRVKNTLKTINKPVELNKIYIEKSKEGFTSKKEEEEISEKLKNSIEESKTKIKTLENIEEISKEDPILNKIFVRIKTHHDKTDQIEKIIKNDIKEKIVFRTNKLSKLTKKECKLLSKIFIIINEVLPPDIAENLKEKIEEEFR